MSQWERPGGGFPPPGRPFSGLPPARAPVGLPGVIVSEVVVSEVTLSEVIVPVVILTEAGLSEIVMSVIIVSKVIMPGVSLPEIVMPVMVIMPVLVDAPVTPVPHLVEPARPKAIQAAVARIEALPFVDRPPSGSRWGECDPDDFPGRKIPRWPSVPIACPGRWDVPVPFPADRRRFGWIAPRRGGSPE